MNFLMVDGKGDPNTAPDYADAVEALYGVRYAIKLLSRRTLGRDYVVPPLEGLWSSDDPAAFTQMNKRKVFVDDDDHAAGLDYPGKIRPGN
jgi:hypothetical protein